MTARDILHWVGAGALLAYGIASTIWPRWVANFLEHGLSTGRGVSEFRVAHGGGMVGLALAALVVNNPLVFQLVGWGWLGAAAVRVIAYLPDRPALKTDYFAFLVAEVVLGVCLLA